MQGDAAIAMTEQDEDAMRAGQQRQVEFFLARPGGESALRTIAGLGLRPALFAGYRDLAALRHDFPLLLARGRRDETAVRTLAQVFDAALAALADAPDIDRLRHHALRLEREIRSRAGRGGTLKAVWQQSAAALTGADAAMADSLGRLAGAVADDGAVVACDAGMPAAVVRHAFDAVQRRKAGRFRTRIERLLRRLRDILAADRAASEAGRTAASLRASIGPGGAQVFDFEAMSRMLGRARHGSPLTETRRQRIAGLVTVLEAQPFFPLAGAAGDTATDGFAFTSCTAALEAYRQRLPQAAELVRAMAIGELEVDGQYNEARHDKLFARLSASGPAAGDLADFPDYLVVLSGLTLTPVEVGRAVQAMAAGLPLKILVQTDDLLAASPAGGAGLPLALAARSLAETALGLDDVFVMQTPASHLPALAASLFAGLGRPGAALFSVFSGATGHAGALPPYLVAAAALESRVFPAFVHDPAAGADWAARFSLVLNPQPEKAWPEYELGFEDTGHKRLAETAAFTAADFLACDDRFGDDLAMVARADWTDRLVSLAGLLAGPARDAAEALPTLLLVDDENRLHKAIADAALVTATRRVAALWRGLQERGGIGNSHAARALEAAKQAWEAAQEEAGAAAPAAAEAAAPAAEAGAAEAEAPSDQPYIETARCSSCNECTLLNAKMFAYDKNKQAFIKDPTAGTYRELVEAAESCQVSVIHPGKPLNPKEPGLEELMERAKPFM
jgi:hypothetical protein